MHKITSPVTGPLTSPITVALAGRSILNKGAGVPAFTYNLRKGQYPAWKAALDTVRAGTGDAVISPEADSTGRGTGSASGGPTQHANGWPQKLKALLAASGIPSNDENVFATGGGFDLATMISTYDNRVSKTGAWTSGGSTSSSNSMGGCYFTTTAAGTLSFTPRTAFDTIEVEYAQSASQGQFSVNVDGGATLQTVVATTSPTAIKKTSITCPKGLHTVNIPWVSGTNTIFGISCYDSTAKQARILNHARHGSSTNEWVAISGTTWGPLDSFPIYGIHLPIICLGINDWRNSIDVATYKTRMQTLISNRITNGAKPLLLTPVFDSSSTGLAAQQEDYVTAMKELAITNDLGLIDIRAKWQSFAAANANGFYFDNVHPSDAGYVDEAETIAAAILFAAA